MTTIKINSITNLPWKRLLFSTMLAGSLAVLPASRATLPVTTSANLTAPAGVTTGVNGQTLTITSTNAISVLNWGAFWDNSANGGTSLSGDTINFSLPGATSSILNTVSGTGITQINAGAAIVSNGKVSLLNPNGVVINNGAILNTGGFYVSTIPESSFYFSQNGVLQVFTSTPPSQASSGSVIVNTTGTTIATPNASGGAGSGDLRFAGNGVQILGTGTLSGNVYITDLGAAQPSAVLIDGVTIASTTNGGNTVGGNLTITSATNNASGGNVDFGQSGGATTTVQGNLVVNSGGANIDLGQITGSPGTIAVTGTVALNTMGATENGAVKDTGGWVLSDTATSGAGVTVVTGSGSGTGNGAIGTAAAPATVLLNANTISVTGGSTSLADAGDSTLTIGNSTISGSLTLTAPNSIVTLNYGSTTATPAGVNMTASSGNGINISADTLNGGGQKLSFNASGSANFVGLVVGNNTITNDTASIKTAGNLTLNNTAALIQVTNLNLTSTGGTISQTTVQGIAVSTLTVSAPTVSLLDAANNIASMVLTGGGTGGISINDATATAIIANGTATTGAVTVTNDNNGNANINLGSNATDSLSFGGNLTLNLASTATAGTPAEHLRTNASTISVAGNTTVNSSGTGNNTNSNSVTLGNNGVSVPAYTFTGPISVLVSGNGGDTSIYGNSALVLGQTTTGPGFLTVQSTLTGTGNSGISNPSGTVTVGGATTLAAGTAAAPSNIQIGTTAQPASLTGGVTVSVGTATANNVTLVNSQPTNLSTSVSTNVVAGQTTITETGNGGLDATTINGPFANISVMDTGSGLTGATNITIGAGNTTLSNFLINGSSTANLFASTTNGSITIGSGFVDASQGGVTLVAQGAKGAIADTASSPVYIFGGVTFVSSGAINFNNNTANDLGGVTFINNGSVGNTSAINYTEGTTANVQGIVVPGGYAGVVSLTSVNGSIIESFPNPGTGISLPASAAFKLTANSTGAQVLLNNTVASNNSIASPVSLSASGSSVLWSNVNLPLSNVVVGVGTLTVNTGSSGAGISEVAGTSIYTYGADTFVTQGGAISLGQSGNNFGAIKIDTTNSGGGTGANASIKEYGGNNYSSVNTGTGNLTATSEQSIILQVGNIAVGGTSTFTANGAAGGILLNATGNKFNGGAVKLTTSGNAVLNDTSGVTVLADGTNVAGTLSVTNSSANGIITDSGSTGTVTAGTGIFVVPGGGAGFVQLQGAFNNIPNLEVTAGTGNTTIITSSNLNILPGTAVSGPASIQGANITITQIGNVTFQSTLALNAVGNINFSNTSSLFNGKVTAVATAPGDVNFSALSLANNFRGITPSVTTTNNATNYQPPGP